MISPVVGSDLVGLRDLQARALETLAGQWAVPRVSGRHPTDSTRRAALREAAVTTGRLAVAARQTATAAARAGWPHAVEVADAISTTAQVLRMLAELELTAIPGA